MKNFQEIRKDLINLLAPKTVALTKYRIGEWFKPAFPDDDMMVNWLNESGNRALCVFETDDDETLPFSYFFSKRGVDSEISCLTLTLDGSTAQSDEIWKIVEAWLIHDGDRELVGNLVETLFCVES